MKPRRRHTRYFYPVGLLSMVLLPLVFAWDVMHSESVKVKTTVEVNLLPLPITWETFAKEHHAIGPGGHWTTFQFPTDRESERIVLDSLEAAIRLHRMQYDTVNGIRVRFLRETTYDTFIHLLDFLALEGISRYAIEDSLIWIASQAPQSGIISSQNRVFICGMAGMKTAPEAPDRQLHQLLEGYTFLMDPSHRGTLALIASAWILIGLLNVFHIHRLYSRD